MTNPARITREWAMPNRWTFAIPPIKFLLDKYMSCGTWIDPFAGKKSPAGLTNDIEPGLAMFSMDALEFLKKIKSQFQPCNGVLFDPPYSVEQCLRRYTPKRNGTAGRAEYWAKCKDEISKILKVFGLCISFGWDSTGIGIKRGFEILEILLVCHGACHNDTIVTVERKITNVLG